MLSAMLGNKSEGMRYEKILIKTFFEKKTDFEEFCIIKKNKII